MAVKLNTLQSVVARLPSYGNRKAVGLRHEFGLRWWSYRQLHDEVFRVAKYLKDRNIRKGDCILLQAPNCPEWAAFLLGAALCGVIVVPADEGSSPEFLECIAREVNAKLFIYGPNQNRDVLKIPAESIYLPGVGPAITEKSEPAAEVDPDDPALIFYTSGTTTRPRGVVITHRNLVSAITPFQKWRPMVRLIPFRLLSMSPISHIQGAMLGICVPLSIGLSVIYTHSISPQHMIRTIRTNRVTLLVAVPRLQQLLAKAILQSQSIRYGVPLEKKLQGRRRWLQRHYIFREVRALLGYKFWVLLVGGASVPVEDERFWRDSGCFFIQGYGLTETTCFVAVNSPFSRRPGTLGKPLSNVSVRIAEDGEVLVQGSSVTPGYYHDDSSNKQAFADGFLKTGDLVRNDHKNRLYFLGRKKDFIVTSEGHNVHPHEVEAIMNRLPGVNDSVVLGIEREGHEEIHAVLLLESGASAPGIIRRANSLLQPHQAIGSWTTWPFDDFPRARLLKVKRSEVAQFVRNSLEKDIDSASLRDSPPTLEEIKEESDRKKRVQLIARYITETPGDKFTAGDIQLVDNLGLSSIDMVQLTTILENKCFVSLEEVISPGTTLADIRSASRQEKVSGSYLRPAAGQARWARTPPGSLLRIIFRSLIIGTWSLLCTRVKPFYKESLTHLKPPFIMAVVPHVHWLDSFVVYAALPKHLRRKIMIVSNRDFKEYIHSFAGLSFFARLGKACAYYLFLPVLFNFSILPHFGKTREGLLDLGGLMDRGYCPITFPRGLRWGPDPDKTRHDPGAALMALQTQAPILPVTIEGSHRLDFKPKLNPSPIIVKFYEPVNVTPDLTRQQVIDRVEKAFTGFSEEK